MQLSGKGGKDHNLEPEATGNKRRWSVIFRYLFFLEGEGGKDQGAS